MKTLEEFIQRLQNDPAFEKQAQAFDHGDDLIAFVKRQGYDFTLEQLMSEFERGEKLPAETGDLAPAPADVSPSPPPRPDEPEFPWQPEALSSPESGTSLLETGNDDFSREQPLERLPQPEEAMPPTAHVSPSPPPRPDEPEFPWQPEVFSSPESGTDLPKRGNDDFTREQPLERLPQSKAAMPTPEAEEEPRAGLFRGGGGRHRGFSPERLKSISEEDP
ncbi:MAG: Nif11-like leader peptide family natural product precursor [Proteobacteria bacterium]|nr:Nif11-like leader peptide family natural product precursor [Pseudomonadota bacterium]MBU4356738.1 Nif11-like leader peptide family natural product precursor [Pseudomonadota bacterium]MBU4449032.1 Nif11-like leader peptide family natural product precursor [Pseudomonadota bacterium]MCG2772481.1 Nif11-like leader peptide family natural product precursor [Desulfobacterales bacterium]